MNTQTKILNCLKKRDLTIREMAKETKVKENTIRVVINRTLKPDLIKETGLHRDRYKVYTLNKRSNGELKKGFQEFNSLFSKLSQKIAKEGKLGLEEYRSLVQEIDRNLIIKINKKIEE